MKKLIKLTLITLTTVYLGACSHAKSSATTETAQTNPVGAPTNKAHCRELKRLILANDSGLDGRRAGERTLEDKRLTHDYHSAGCTN